MQEESECRICRGESTPQSPLLTPCKCDGSIAPVHEMCLRKWLETNGSQKCELCGYKYRWRPVFPPNTPAQLPRYELFAACFRYAAAIAPQVAHVFVCVFVWFFSVPVMTAYLYRALVHFPSFFAMEGGLRMLLATRLLSFRFLVQDWIAGFIILVFLVLCTFSNATLSDAIKIEAEALTRRIIYFSELNTYTQSLNEEENADDRFQLNPQFVDEPIEADNEDENEEGNDVHVIHEQQQQQQQRNAVNLPPQPFIPNVVEREQEENGRGGGENHQRPDNDRLQFLLEGVVNVYSLFLIYRFSVLTAYPAVMRSLLASGDIWTFNALKSIVMVMLLFCVASLLVFLILRQFLAQRLSFTEQTINHFLILSIFSVWAIADGPAFGLGSTNRFMRYAFLILGLFFLVTYLRNVNDDDNHQNARDVNVAVGGRNADRDLVGGAQAQVEANNAHAQALNEAAARARRLANEVAQDQHIDNARALRAEEVVVQDAARLVASAAFPELLPPDALDPALARKVLELYEVGGDAFVRKSMFDQLVQGWKPLGGMFTACVTLPIRGAGTFTCVSGALNYFLLGTSDEVFSNPRILAQCIALSAVLVGIYISEVKLLGEFPRGWSVNAQKGELIGTKDQRAAAAAVAAFNGRPHITPPLVNDQIELRASLVRLRMRTAAYYGGIGLVIALATFTLSASVLSRLNTSSIYTFALYVDPQITRRLPGLEPKPSLVDGSSLDQASAISTNAVEVSSAFLLDMWIGIFAFASGCIAALSSLPEPERDLRAFKSLVELRSAELFATIEREERAATIDGDHLHQPTEETPRENQPHDETNEEIAAPLIDTEEAATFGNPPLSSPRSPEHNNEPAIEESSDLFTSPNFSNAASQFDLVDNHVEENKINNDNDGGAAAAEAAEEEGWTTVVGRRTRHQPQPLPVVQPPEPVNAAADRIGGAANDRVRRRRRRGGGRNNNENNADNVENGGLPVPPPAPRPQPQIPLQRQLPQGGRGGRGMQDPRLNRFPRNARNQPLPPHLQQRGGAGGRGPLFVPGDLEDDDGFRVEMPIVEALGLRPPVVHLFLHALVGLVFVFLGLCFFIAMPILSSRSGFLFMKRTSNGYLAWLTFLFDFSALFWSKNPHPTDFVIVESDVLFLVSAYLSVLTIISLLAILDEISRVLILAYLSARSFYVNMWCRLNEVAQNTWTRLFSSKRGAVASNAAATASSSVTADGSSRPSLLQRVESYVMPEYVQKVIRENWPRPYVTGILTYTEHSRSIMLLARLSFILFLRIVLIPILIGVAMGIAAMPGMKQLWIPETESISQTALEVRVSMIVHKPLSVFVAHWMMGWAVLAIVSTLFLRLREVLRYDLLARWTYQPDPRHGILKSIFDLPISRQLFSLFVTTMIVWIISMIFNHIPLTIITNRGLHIAVEPVVNQSIINHHQPLVVENAFSNISTADYSSLVSKNKTDPLLHPLEATVWDVASLWSDAVTSGIDARGTFTVLSIECVRKSELSDGPIVDGDFTSNEGDSNNNNDDSKDNEIDDDRALYDPESNFTLTSGGLSPPQCARNRVLAVRLFVQATIGRETPFSGVIGQLFSFATPDPDSSTMTFTLGGVKFASSSSQTKHAASSSSSSIEKKSPLDDANITGSNESISNNESTAISKDSIVENDSLISIILAGRHSLLTLEGITSSIILNVNRLLRVLKTAIRGFFFILARVTKMLIYDLTSSDPIDVKIIGKYRDFRDIVTGLWNMTFNPLDSEFELFEAAEKTAQSSFNSSSSNSSTRIVYRPVVEAPFFNVTIYEGSREFDVLSPAIWAAMYRMSNWAGAEQEATYAQWLKSANDTDSSSLLEKKHAVRLPRGLPRRLFFMHPVVHHQHINSSSSNVTDSNETTEPLLSSNSSFTVNKTSIVYENLLLRMPVFKLSTLQSLSSSTLVYSDSDERSGVEEGGEDKENENATSFSFTSPRNSRKKFAIQSLRIRWYGEVALKFKEVSSSSSSSTTTSAAAFELDMSQEAAKGVLKPTTSERATLPSPEIGSPWIIRMLFPGSAQSSPAVDVYSMWLIPLSERSESDNEDVDDQYQQMWRPPSGFDGLRQFKLRTSKRSNESLSSSSSSSSSPSIGSVVLHGKHKGMRVCHLLNVTQSDFFSSLGKDPRNADGHRKISADNNSSSSKRKERPSSLLINSSSLGDDADIDTATNASIRKRTKPTIFHSYLVDSKSGQMIDCGETRSPAETLAAMIPTRQARLLLLIRAPRDQIFFSHDSIKHVLELAASNHRANYRSWSLLIPQETERVVLSLFKSSNVSFASSWMATVRSFITSSTNIDQISQSFFDSQVVQYMITNSSSSSVVNVVYTSAETFVKSFTSLLEKVVDSSIVFLYSLFLGVMPMKAAWYALSWQLPFDTLILSLGLLLVLEALKAFCSMVQAFMVELGSKLMSLEEHILPPKETLRFYIFSTPPSLEVLDASSLSKTDGGKEDESALIDAAISLADKSAHLSLLEVSANTPSSFSSSSSSSSTAWSGSLVPPSAVCDVIFYRHVDGTPGVGRFRPRPGTWAQVINSKHLRRNDGGDDAASNSSYDGVLPPEIPLPTGCRGAGIGGEGPDTGFERVFLVKKNDSNDNDDNDDDDEEEERKGSSIRSQNSNSRSRQRQGGRRKSGASKLLSNQPPPRITSGTYLSDLAQAVGGAGGSSHLLSLGLREANFMLHVGAAAGMDSSALLKFLHSTSRNKTRAESILRLTSAASLVMRAINSDSDQKKKSSFSRDPAFEKDVRILDEVRLSFSNEDFVALVKDTLLFNELVSQRSTVSAKIAALDARKRTVRASSSSSATTAAVASSTSTSTTGITADSSRTRTEFETEEDASDEIDADGEDDAFVDEGSVLASLLAFLGFEGENDDDDIDEELNDNMNDAERVLGGRRRGDVENNQNPPRQANNNNDNNGRRQQRRRRRRVRDVQLPVLVTEPLQMLASSNAITLSWEYLNLSETDRVLDESSVRLRLAFEGDGVSLSDAAAAVASSQSASVASHAEDRLRVFSQGLLHDFLFQADATLGASGAFISDATVFGIRDDERVEFREYVNSQRAASATSSSSLDARTNLASSESSVLSDIAQARFALSLHQSVARANAYPVFCSMSSIASRVTSGVSRPVDTARSIGLLSPTGSILEEMSATNFDKTAPSSPSSLSQRPLSSIGRQAEDTRNVFNTDGFNDNVDADTVAISIEPDSLSMELQRALMIEEALSKATPEMLRKLRVQYVEAAYDLEEEAAAMASSASKGRRRYNRSSKNHEMLGKDRSSQNTKLVDSAKSRGIDLSAVAQNVGNAPPRSSFSVELDPTTRPYADYEEDHPTTKDTMENVRLLDPPGRTLRPYLTQPRILPLFVERPVALPSLLRKVGITTGATTTKTPSSSSSSTTTAAAARSPFVHAVVELSSNRLWPDECSVCGCVREEIGVYSSFIKIHEGTNNEVLVCDDYCKQKALKMESNGEILPHLKKQKKSTTSATSMSNDEQDKKAGDNVKSMLVRVKRHTHHASSDSLSFSALILTRIISFGKKILSAFFWPLTSLWSSSLGVVLLRFPAFLFFEITFAWICTAICVGISLGLGRAFLSSLCIPLHIQHDATGFVLGGYAFLLLLDYAVICKYTLSNTIGGYVRRYAMAVARAASQLEDSFAQKGAQSASKSSRLNNSSNNIGKSKGSVNISGHSSVKSSSLMDDETIVRVPQSLCSRFKISGDGDNKENLPLKSVDLFDLAVLSCDDGALADHCKVLSGRFKLFCLKLFIRYIGLPVWQCSVKEKLHIGNVHSTPREMNPTRIYSLFKAAFVNAFVTALWVGIAWTSLADPVSLTTLLFEFVKRVSGIEVMSHEPLRMYFAHALEPNWRLAGPLSSFLSMMLMGVYLLSVAFETFVSGSLGETYKGWAELYEWRLISVHSTRFWARKLAPTLFYCMKTSMGGCITAVVVVCGTALLATERSLGLCLDTNSDNENDTSLFSSTYAWIPSICSIEGTQVIARTSVVLFALARLGVFLWSRRQLQDSFVMRFRVWLLSWSERLRRQRYSIDKALLNFKRRSYPSTAATV